MLGKVLLAYTNPDDWPPMELRRFTANTITTRKGMLASREEILARGWGRDEQEHEETIRCIAAPVFGSDGAIAAAVSVSVPTSRLSAKDLEVHVPLLLEVADSITKGSAAGSPPSADERRGSDESPRPIGQPAQVLCRPHECGADPDGSGTRCEEGGHVLVCDPSRRDESHVRERSPQRSEIVHAAWAGREQLDHVRPVVDRKTYLRGGVRTGNDNSPSSTVLVITDLHTSGDTTNRRPPQPHVRPAQRS